MYPSCRFVIVACVLIGAACTGCPDEEPVPPAGPYEVGGFTVEFADASFSVTHSERADALREVHLVAGHADADVQMQFGSFRFEELDEQFDDPTDLGVVSGDAARLEVTLLDGEAIEAARLVFEADGDDGLVLSFTPTDASCNRVRLEAACDADDHFLGLGSHAMDVDHMGQAFPLWVSEPGIGKAEDEDYPDDWYFTGTRHASSYPFPFLLRPHQAHGLLIDSTARLELDLCASDADRFSVEVWDGTARFLLLSGDGPLAVVEALTETTGRIDLPEPWVFTPWNDAVRGVDRVREGAALLRESGAPSSVIWTEDWKGAEEGAFGYHLEGEWFLDEEMYPDAQDLADELEADGFKWFAYFSPFLIDGTETWDQAVADGVTILDEYGDPYVFEGVTFEDTSMVDLTSEAARAWVVEHMEAALDIGFDGWMADYAEWLPLDAVLASGEDPWLVHNDYTVRWQQLNHELLGEHDAAFFSRSGWLGAAPLAPVVWAGDQRTSFDADDGFPTVIPLGLGLSACGVPVYTHDVAGYQSVGNPPTDKELWFRWTTLGAFSPVMRTHHGAFEEDNWQFSSDEESVDHWAAMATEHVHLFPYRYGLAPPPAGAPAPHPLRPGRARGRAGYADGAADLVRVRGRGLVPHGRVDARRGPAGGPRARAGRHLTHRGPARRRGLVRLVHPRARHRGRPRRGHGPDPGVRRGRHHRAHPGLHPRYGGQRRHGRRHHPRGRGRRARGLPVRWRRPLHRGRRHHLHTHRLPLGLGRDRGHPHLRHGRRGRRQRHHRRPGRTHLPPGGRRLIVSAGSGRRGRLRTGRSSAGRWWRRGGGRGSGREWLRRGW